MPTRHYLSMQAFTDIFFTTLFQLAEVEQLDIGDMIEFFDAGLDRRCDPGEIIATEALVLKTLNYTVSGPTSWTFLQRFLTAINPSGSTQKRALYILECSLYMEDLLTYHPSDVAATVVCLAIRNPAASDECPQSMVRCPNPFRIWHATVVSSVSLS